MASNGRKKRKELTRYYGTSDENCFDINSKHFNDEVYVQKIIKEKNLKQLLEEETNLVNDIQKLDSECQTLVYDHYDKFISATDIVRQMKEGSAEMNAQVTRLQQNMNKITESSENITKDLQDQRDKLGHLLGIHSTLTKLQFLFQLPQKIDECIKEKRFAEGVRSYVETTEVLQRYKHLPSFSATYADCKKSLEVLIAALKSELAVEESSTQHLTLCVDLLKQLGEPAKELCDEFLFNAQAKLNKDLKKIKLLVDKHEVFIIRQEAKEESKDTDEHLDVLQFVDVCHETFVVNLLLVISSYKEMFVNRSLDERQSTKQDSSHTHAAGQKLCKFVVDMIENEYIPDLERRLKGERSTEEVGGEHYEALTNALAKIHRRMQAIATLVPDVDVLQYSMRLSLTVCHLSCKRSLAWLHASWTSRLADVREWLAAPKPVTQSASAGDQLNELLTHLVASTASNIKDRFDALMEFTQERHCFLSKKHSSRIVRSIREEVVVDFFKEIAAALKDTNESQMQHPALLLLLSRMCVDLHTSTIHYLLSHCDAQLSASYDKDELNRFTSHSQLAADMKETGQQLLNQYVTLQGNTISQMLRRSVELKDWLGCGEPRSVRRVMRTVRDEIAAIDTQVGALYEEGIRKDRSSDSSRRTFHSVGASRAGGANAPPVRSSAPPPSWGVRSPHDDALAAHLSRLWSERIEIFAPVPFARLGILTGIIKIGLKSLVESLRVQTFSRFGFQQVQVDSHYLRTYLWSYFADEHLLNVLLEEAVTSASLRAVDCELMEAKVVEFICEQN